MAREAQSLKIQECIDIIRREFAKIPDPRAFSEIALTDFLTSGYAIFALKFPSLLSFDQAWRNDHRRANLQSLFGIKNAPSDTHLRDVLDLVSPHDIKKIFKDLFAFIQRKKVLEGFEFLNSQNQVHYLISVDGTGYFRSDAIGCTACNSYSSNEKRKVPKYGHNILGASIVHPMRAEVLPLAPEPISIQDGNLKNDCELNAFRRFLQNFREDHPKLGAIFTLDALYANQPQIQLLFDNQASFIIAVKNTHNALFRQVNDGEKNGKTKYFEHTFEIGDKIKKQVIYRFRYQKNVHLNQDPNSVRVNFVEFWEEINWEGRKGSQSKKVHFSWVTDLDVNPQNLIMIMKGGRARWKIENETFNTLKNQGYHLEHNYGHGYNNLSVNFSLLMFLAFFVDQIQQASCQKFKKVVMASGNRSALWRKLGPYIEMLKFSSWEQLYALICNEIKATLVAIDSG